MSSASFAQMARQLSGLLPRPTFTPEQLPHLETGRKILREIAAEVRLLRPGCEPDLLMAATMLAGKGREEALQGYFRELQALLARTQP